MKLRISSCRTAFVKDLTRFAPAWILYLIGMVLILFPVIIDQPTVDAAVSLSESIRFFGIGNILYAALCAQLLFGDLFQSRLCNALHAMPLKRGDWFFCHTVAGLCFSLVPNAVCVLWTMPLLGEFWFVPLFWMAALTLQFVFFFGLAVLSMLCTGNRFAMVAVYGLLNFLSLLVLWIVKTVFEPLIYGLYIPSEPFILLSPVVQLLQLQTYLEFGWIGGAGVFTGLGDGWLYLLIVAGAGIVLGALAMLLYRRRALESAGDFVAVRSLAPVFSVVYTLAVAMLIAEFGHAFTNEYLGFFVVGFLVGYFTGQMLLRRTVKVFTGRVLIGGAVFAAVLFACVGITQWDPAGVARWTPEPEQVESVSIADGYYEGYRKNWLKLEDPEDVEAAIALHQTAIQAQGQPANGENTGLTLHYTLKNGRQVIRTYWYGVPANEVRTFFSRPEYVLGYTGEFEAFRDQVSFVKMDHGALSGEFAKELLDAIAADCAAGNMAQNWKFHTTEDTVTWIYFETSDGLYREISVYPCAENTMAWLKENYDLWADENRKYDDYFTGK